MLWLTIHVVLHFLAPVGLARFCFRDRWKMLSVIMILTMLVDLDHLLANPIFDPARCSIGFHPLHSYQAIVAYALLLILPWFRFGALGLLVHMGLDGLECVRLALI